MIDLFRESLQQEIREEQHVWPLKITANSLQEGMPSAVFVFHASLEDDPYAGDVFEAVASVQNISELPEGAGGLDSNGEVCPYYRAPSLTFYARSPEEAEELWEAIVEDVDDLVRNWAALNNFQAQHALDPTLKEST